MLSRRIASHRDAMHRSLFSVERTHACVQPSLRSLDAHTHAFVPMRGNWQGATSAFLHSPLLCPYAYTPLANPLALRAQCRGVEG